MTADDGLILNLLQRLIDRGGYRYEDVTNGDGAVLITDTSIDASTAALTPWAARYCYKLIVEDKRPLGQIQQAKSLLRRCADIMIAHQQGFGLVPTATRATDPRWGAVRSNSTSSILTAAAANAGLGLLYAYRALEDIASTPRLTYLASARAAASFLRNVQALGSDGTLFPSKDAGGLTRLYTGGLQDTMNGSGGMFGTLISPSGLAALEFWTELTTTDGDQYIGATATIAGSFDTVPQKLMSACMLDLLEFWRTGTYDVAHGDVRTGLSATTPANSFNPYPFGDGSWAYQDGASSTGTIVTASNFALAVSALYAAEGLSAQVIEIDDYLYSFTSNPNFDIAPTLSPSILARSFYGTYDATIAPSTELLVRDAGAGYVAVKMNASGYYDWGSFGLLAAVRARRHAATFKEARLDALGPVDRFNDGLRTDALRDFISLRGRSGLSFQTAFVETLVGAERRVNDGVAAARFGLSLRELPQSYPVQA